MQRLVAYADELVTSIGPRPSGSSGEQEAAELIAANLEGLGLDTWLQDFSTASSTNWTRILCLLLGILAAGLQFFVSGMMVLASVLAVLAVVLLAVDLLDLNPLNKVLATSPSQNVIARYVPQGADPRRKIVVVAHYDAGRTLLQSAPPIAALYPLFTKAIGACLVALLIVILVAFLPLPEIALLLCSIVGLMLGVILLITAIIEIVNFFMPHSQGANCNASGVAAMMGVAEALVSTERRSGTPPQRQRSSEPQPSRRSRGSSSSRSARDSASAGLGGAAGSLLSKARGLIGGGSAESNEDEEQPRGANSYYDDFSESPSKTRIRSGVPVNRNGEPVQRAAYSDEYAKAPAPGEGALDTGTADLGKEVGRAARAAGQAGLSQVPAKADAFDNLMPQSQDRPDLDSGAREPARDAARSRIERGATDNPAIRVRETLAERQEQERLLQDKVETALQEASGKTKDGMPAWFVDAKKAANKETEKNTAAAAEPQVARSRFADVPVETQAVSEPQPSRGIKASSGLAPATSRAQSPYAEASSVHEPARDQRQSAEEERRFSEAAPRAEEAEARAVTEAEAMPARRATQPEPRQKSVPMAEPPTTLNADFSGIDRLASDPMPAQPQPSRLPRSATSLEHAAAAPTPDIPAHESLRNLPKLSLGSSGSIPTQQAAFDQQVHFDSEEHSGEKRVSNTGSFAPLGATGIMKPVGEELLQYHEDEQDIYIDDADESAAWHAHSRSGGRAPHIMNIPQSRAKSFFGNLGDRLSGSRKTEHLDSSPATWLGVDQDFDARSEGSQIGRWENFSEEEGDGWKGGAYGGASAEENAQELAAFSSVLIDKEVWIVAVGAHENRNTGIRKLFAEYERELKSALVINLDSVGAGELCYTMAEGSLRPRGTDHRLQGLVKSAADAVGIELTPTGFMSYTTDAAEALALGSRAISIIGLDGALPVGWRWKNDRLDLLDEDNLQAVASVVIEVIKSA